MPSQAEIDEALPPRGRRRWGRWTLLAGLLLIAAAFALAWLNRETIAGNVIADELEKLGIEATYKVDRIGGRRQVLRDIVVGDPRRPDLTVERAEVVIRHRFGFPRVERISLLRPRLFGTLVDGTLSFGELDPLIFRETDREFEFPDVELAVSDGRALIEGDYGPVAVKLSGSGHLREGFAGELAALAPRLAVPGCERARATLYGRVSIADQRPRFAGPVRFGRVACADGDVAIAGGTVRLDGRADRALAGFEGNAELDIDAPRVTDNRLAALGGTARFAWRDGGLTARYDLTGRELLTGQVAVARLGLDGSLRARRNFARLEVDAAVEGQGVRLGPGLDRTLVNAAEETAGSLLGPIFRNIRAGLAREGRRSRLVADVSLRRTGERLSVVVPNAAWRGSSGATLLALSRFQLAMAGKVPRFTGNFSTGGEGLPRIAGRMEQVSPGLIQARLAMAEYQAGPSQLAIPELVLTMRRDGAVGFAGTALASGALPGGEAQGLLLPLSGNWSPGRGLALWNGCTDLRFERLRLANLTIDSRRLTLCPPPGTSIVRLDGGGLKIAAGAPTLEIAGRLGQTPIALRSGPVGFAYPGAISARRLVVSLGPPATAATFAIDDLTAQVGEDIAGRFAGTDVRLFNVPLDLLGASGNWRYAGGRLTIADGSFRLEDRRDPDRFEPLTAEGATLALENNIITAEALMREPRGGREVTQVDVVHNLATATGHADLLVAGLTFDPTFQPVDLSERARGVVALVRGTVTGTGRIDWSPSGATSTGTFSTDSLDFAAAFGPVKGASGTVEFTDLLGMTTAPNQRLRVQSINPGIEVADGEIEFQLRGGRVLALQGATWPFMGGTLTMRAVDLNLGVSEVRRYVLEIVGLDAARFVERMELNNISATGIFDGTIPLVFDGSGSGRVEGGVLLSRPPGGNVSYVGDLTYENMGAIANFAFATLRSIDYQQMRIGMDGSLTGELVTRVRIDGVSQGAGTEQNIITRAIAGLPIRLEINVRAPFYQLITSARSLYDPAAVKDPRSPDVGLLDADGNIIAREREAAPPRIDPSDIIPTEAPIQRRESEEMP